MKSKGKEKSPTELFDQKIKEQKLLEKRRIIKGQLPKVRKGTRLTVSENVE